MRSLIVVGAPLHEVRRVFLSSLFAKNPFTPLKEHMRKTHECVEETRVLFDALYRGDKPGLIESVRKVSRLEHEADAIKDEIRSRLHSSVFLPVDRRDVLNVLSHMDTIADQAEDIGVLLSLRWMEMIPPLKEPFDELRERVYDVVEKAAQVIDAFDTLLEAGFAGPDAERALALVDEVCRLEHLADKAQDRFGKALFAHEDEFKPAALFMWIKIANKVGDIANASERMVNQLRIMLSR